MAVHYLKVKTDTNEIYHNQQNTKSISFNKNELNMLLSFYGKKVSQGILKDYAIDHLSTYAIFSFYRNTFERAYLQIKKNHKSSKSKSKYCLINASGSILKHNDSLEMLINYITNSKLTAVK